MVSVNWLTIGAVMPPHACTALRQMSFKAIARQRSTTKCFALWLSTARSGRHQFARFNDLQIYLHCPIVLGD